MIPSRFPVYLLLVALVFGALAGCYPGYRMDLEQGNFVTREQRALLQLGMDRREVQFVLGSPLVNDPFHADRWDYVYIQREGATGTVNQQSLSLFFEEDFLVNIHHNSDGIITDKVDSKTKDETNGGGLLLRLWKGFRTTD